MIDFCAEKGDAAGHLRFAQAVEQERAGEAMGTQEAQVQVVVEQPFAGGLMPGVAVAVEILGMRQRNVLTHERERLFDDLLHAGQGSGGEYVRGIHGDFQVRRAYLIHELAGLAGGIDDVVDFRLKGEDGLGLANDFGRVANAGGHVAPGLRGAILGMPAPHALLVAGAGANVNRHAGESLGEDAEAAQTLPAVFGIRMTHVESTLDAGDGEAARRGFAEKSRRESGRDLIGHFGQAGATHAHLDAGEPVGLGLIQARLERASRVGGVEEDADLGRRAWRLRAGGFDGGEAGERENLPPGGALCWAGLLNWALWHVSLRELFRRLSDPLTFQGRGNRSSGYTEDMSSGQGSPGITELLRHWQAGDRQALSAVIENVYPELRKIAAGRLRAQSPNATISPTELLHEAWIRLAQAEGLSFEQRAPFFTATAVIMRNVLVDRARAKSAAKRDPANSLPVQLPTTPEFDLPSMDRALNALEVLSPRQARQVDLRFFGGFSAEETSEILSVSSATLKRDWLAARMFIKQFIESGL